jgi:hypothetical protein
MPLGGLAKVGDSNGLGVAASNFKEDEIQPGSFKITPGWPKWSQLKNTGRQGQRSTH